MLQQATRLCDSIPSFRNLADFMTGRRTIVLVLLGIAVGGLLLIWNLLTPAPVAPDDRQGRTAEEAAGPRYVDDARCAECHSDIYETYRAHPMGRSMASVDEVIGEYAAAPASEGFTAGKFRYEVLRRGQQLLHAETCLDEQGDPIATTALPVAYVVGSGQRGRSFLIDRDSRLYMSPITWYPQQGRWDLSPGYEDRNSHFNRPVIVQCLFCHTNRARPVADTQNTYERPMFSGHAIGCQRCHGPGEAHVALHDGTDPVDSPETIVNPAALEPLLRDAVCQQCHLSGTAKIVRRGKSLYDFRPGMPLEDVLRVFVDATSEGDRARFVGHVEQMDASRCYQASGGQMGCITCHDPHTKPAADVRVDYFRSKCLACHQENDCTETLELRHAAGDDNCMQCHMPARPTEIRHAAITDHRILRRPEAASGEGIAADSSVRGILPFHTPAATDADLRRDRALALLRVEDSESVELGQDLLQAAARDLQDAVRRHPDDVAAWEGFGIAAWRLGNPSFALTCFETVLGQSPRREFALSNAATLSASLSRTSQALRYSRIAVEVNPWMVRYRAELSQVLASSGRWAECEAVCRETLQFFPNSHRSRQLLVESLLAQGKQSEAATEFETWRRFRPADPDKLRAWFENHPLRRSQ